MFIYKLLHSTRLLHLLAWISYVCTLALQQLGAKGSVKAQIQSVSLLNHCILREYML